jgi:hypothetical protein
VSETVLDRPLEIYAPFDARESARLRGFVADVEELASCSFFENPGSKITLSGGVNRPLTTQLTYAGEEAVRAVVPIFRQLYSHKEPTSFVRVFDLLADHARARGSEATNEALAALKEFRTAEREILRDPDGVDLRLDNERLTPRVLVDLFLNGHYLHKGNAKSDKLAQWPLADLTKQSFFATLVHLRNLYWTAANVVRRILAQTELLDAPVHAPVE